MQKNQLYYGDNLGVLREHIKDESVDLIYLDPPFNSRQDYNVLFAEKDGTRSSSQIMAFEDTWEWNIEAESAYEEIVERGGRVSDAMRAFRTFLGNSDMMAYLPRVFAYRYRIIYRVEHDEVVAAVIYGKRMLSRVKTGKHFEPALAVHSGLSRALNSDVELGRKELCLRSLETFADALAVSLSQLMSQR